MVNFDMNNNFKLLKIVYLRKKRENHSTDQSVSETENERIKKTNLRVIIF